MRVGTRITAATSVVVAVSLAVFAVVELRRQSRERRAEEIEEARSVARAVRANLETHGVKKSVARAAELSAALSRSDSSWEVSVVPAEVANRPDDPRHRRIKTMVEARFSGVVTEVGNTITYSLPLRATNPSSPEGFDVAAVIDVSRTRPAGTELWRAIPLLLVIVGLVVVAVLYFTHRLVTRPIEKLLAGIDDVAQGDLSHVILSEREDEVGALATRFNAMTQSLRESRAETARQYQARHQLEDRLFQTEKLATIGQLAAEIAHEVGTPLNVIVGRARSLAKKAGGNETVAKNAGIIAEQATRITRIIQRLLDVARRKVGSVETEPVDLNELAVGTIEFLEGRLESAGVRTKLELDETLPSVNGRPDQLQQVLLNLFINAIEAMPAGGKLEVTTSQVVRRRPGLEEVEPESCAVLAVSDSGEGVAADLRERVFEPFYTSKDREGGTGLGLAVSQGIVREHDGWLEIDEAPGGGARFRVFLPVEASNSPGVH
jgi:signal transduction histidine kinase